MNFVRIYADLESQLEIVSEVPGKFIQLSPDEWPQHTPSRIRSTASTRAVSSIGDVPASQPLDPTGVLAKSITLLGKLRSERSLEEGSRVDPGVTTTKPECTENFQRQRTRKGKGLRQLRAMLRSSAFCTSVTENLE